MVLRRGHRSDCVLLRARDEKHCRNNAAIVGPAVDLLQGIPDLDRPRGGPAVHDRLALHQKVVICYPGEQAVHPFGRMSLQKIARRTSRAPSAISARSIQLWEPCTILNSRGPTDKQTVRRSPRSQLR